ncbi:MAG: DUF484 family protein [Candidatus Dactylopiibacterium sp.]|nr:DUF484 family protein [Candidatus Dactylopiibacterium sp.]
MEPQDIADHLQRHPDFFERHPELLAGLSVPHPLGGQAISLTERQLFALRDKLGQVQAKLAELVAFGEENDVITTRIHRLALALLAAESFEAARFAVYASLREDFTVPHVALRLWSCTQPQALGEFATVSEELRFQVADMRHPACGPAQHSEVLGWFGETAPQLRSMALIPLRHESRLVGLLALASEDPERFFPEMGTLYVTRIGELVATAVLAHTGG